MQTKTQTRRRFIVMSVPDDADGAFWFAYDCQTHRSIELQTYEAARAEVRRLNVK